MPIDASEVVDRHYGAKITAVEPGGAEAIPLAERHGRPIQLLWTWTSPNMEFATVFVGVICVLFFGLTFWEAVLAIALGTGLGAISHGVLSSWGPKTGQCQMVLSRRGFGFLGNFLPAGLNSLTAGIGWFAVNSVSGGLALAALTGLNKYLCLVIVVAAMLAIAYFGHNLIQMFERFAFPLLAVIFVIGAVVILTKSNAAAPPIPTESGDLLPGGFWIALGATFGYAAGWNPYASDYTRYLPNGSGKAAGLYAAVGLFVSCLVLESVGAAAVTAVGGPDWNYDNPVASYTGSAADLAGEADPAGDLCRRDRGQRAERLLQRVVLHRDGDQAADEVLPGGHGDRDGHPRFPGGRARHRQHRQVRELPAGDRLLDRSVARGGLRRSPAAPGRLG